MGEGGSKVGDRRGQHHPLRNLVSVGLPALASPDAQPKDDGAEQRNQDNDKQHFAKAVSSAIPLLSS